MLYLQANAAQNTQIFLKQETDPSDSNRERNITIANAATTLASISVRIQSELSHARSTHEKAFNAYSEFEKTYAQHVVLQIIYDDYIQLRKNLRDVMNPLSQLIYKHNNSTNQYDN